MEILVPVVDMYGDRIIGTPNHVISLDKDAITIRYNYEYEKLLDADDPSLGKIGDTLKIMEEYTILRSSISLICVTRDEPMRVFSVGLDYAGVYYNVSVNFKSLTDARNFKNTITTWWLAPFKGI